MATFADKFNKVGFGVNTKDFKYVKLSDLYAEGTDTVHVLNGIFINNSPLGVSPVFIESDKKRLVNIPSHMAQTCHDILSDTDAVNAIKNGKVGYKVYTYETKGKKCFSVSFVDL